MSGSPSYHAAAPSFKSAEIAKVNGMVKQMQQLEQTLNGLIDSFDLNRPFDVFIANVNDIRSRTFLYNHFLI